MVTYIRQRTALLVIDPITISSRRAASYGIASRPLQKQIVVFLICCRF